MQARREEGSVVMLHHKLKLHVERGGFWLSVIPGVEIGNCGQIARIYETLISFADYREDDLRR